MSTPQPSPELTTRDVLQQIDHRLSLIETDVRENNTKIEAKIDALEAKTEAKFNALEGKIDALDSKFEGKIDALDSKSKARLKSKYANCAASSTANLTWLSAWSSPLGCR